MNENNLYTIAFYNLENLFDTINDPNILDNDFTEDGRLHWDDERYENKLYKLGKAISEIGAEETGKAPALVGMAEVENKKVLNDLLSVSDLKNFDYDYVHFNSPDERGIDTALLYNKKHFEVLEAEPITLMVYNEEADRDFTRDILYVHGNLFGEAIHLYVNHWPSRRHGADETSHKRIAAAKTLVNHMEVVKGQHPHSKFVIMGDFNDDPNSTSIKDHLMTPYLYNPMLKLLIPAEQGSLTYQSRWNLFDQIIISNNFFDVSDSQFTFEKADILNERFLEEWNKKYEGFPFRTYVGRKYLGGYSDHFPVFIILRKK